MTDSKAIAQLAGPTLLALSASEALNLHIWAANLVQVTYLDGLVLFAAGLAIVRVHNFWPRGWPLLVTLVGWGSLALGLFRMFAPQARQGGPNAATHAILAILLGLGAFLTWKGYERASPR
jgi:hypothetical protein